MPGILAKIGNIKITRKLVATSFLGGLPLFAGLNVLLYFSAERWRTYSNDILPCADDFFDDSQWPIRLYFQLPFLAASLLVPVIFHRSRGLLVGSGVGLLAVFCFQYHRLVVIRQQNAISSCANHSAFWSGQLLRSGISKEQYQEHLPSTTEFADFIYATNDMSGLDLSGFVCPGYKRVGTKTGVVFVGGGLSYRTLVEQDVLLAFCSWQAHKPPRDHQHCLLTRGSWRRCTDTRGMIKNLQRALKQAEDSSVPYSPEAVEILAHELDMRVELVGD